MVTLSMATAQAASAPASGCGRAQLGAEGGQKGQKGQKGQAQGGLQAHRHSCGRVSGAAAAAMSGSQSPSWAQ